MKIRIFDAGARNQLTSGYGLLAKQVGENLALMGHDVCYFPDDKSGEDVVLWIRPPHYIKYPEFNKNKKNVFFTMHESETFEGWKSDWPELLNKTTAVIVPTEWNKESFIKNGVKVPIHVVPLGVNPKHFHGGRDYIFSILTLHDRLGSDSSRENWKDTITAYYNVFANDKPYEVSLTIKSYNIDHLKYVDFLNKLKVKMGKAVYPMINIIDIPFLPDQLNDLYAHHWLFVKNANREGWSLPLLEAISGNMDVAYTNLPVFNWAKGYKRGLVFPIGNVKALENIFINRFKQWKKHRGFINNFAWKHCASGVENVIKSIKD